MLAEAFRGRSGDGYDAARERADGRRSCDEQRTRIVAEERFGHKLLGSVGLDVMMCDALSRAVG